MGVEQARDAEQEPPRGEGVVPLREARRGKARSASGGQLAKAAMPVCARPRISACTSCVPS
ncbi:hypothetical protein F3K36_14360 [Delftia sp. BR1]|nr:hypothetical protein F3K36_14360 [Delftia sp. BR1]